VELCFGAIYAQGTQSVGWCSPRANVESGEGNVTKNLTITETNRLMLFRETIAVYCENHTEHINTLCGQNAEFSSYLTGNTLVSATKPTG
jgi:hypothetical protein